MFISYIASWSILVSAMNSNWYILLQVAKISNVCQSISGTACRISDFDSRSRSVMSGILVCFNCLVDESL